jgi:hypothetical protein
MFSARFPFTPPYLSAGLCLLVLLCLPVPLTAQTGKSLTSFDNICLAEARRAETTHGIPAGLLQSISRVESGRKMVTGEYMPWAWTLNDRGEGLFFDDREAALAYLRDAVATPGHSVDVGCMQVNTKWHAEAFPDIADMLDPVHNASYAAGFLLDLHAAHQSWDEAVKRYHSAEPGKNVAYHRRVLAELERFMADSDPVVVPDIAPVDLAANSQADGAMMPAQELGSAEMVLMTGPSEPDRARTRARTRSLTRARPRHQCPRRHRHRPCRHPRGAQSRHIAIWPPLSSPRRLTGLPCLARPGPPRHRPMPQMTRCWQSSRISPRTGTGWNISGGFLPGSQASKRYSDVSTPIMIPGPDPRPWSPNLMPGHKHGP